MQLIEQFIALISPHYCIECQQEGQLLCKACTPDVFAEVSLGCALCNAPTKNAAVCGACRLQTSLSTIWTLGDYEGTVEKLVNAYKFTPARAASRVIAEGLHALLPLLPKSTIVLPLPTAPSRVRQRGFDQAVLMAREFAKCRRLACYPLLYRRHNLRQLGASRAVREQQATQAYGLRHSAPLASRSVLLVDDVLTTGASLKAAAALCKKAGCSEIMAAVVARQVLKK